MKATERYGPAVFESGTKWRYACGCETVSDVMVLNCSQHPGSAVRTFTMADGTSFYYKPGLGWEQPRSKPHERVDCQHSGAVL